MNSINFLNPQALRDNQNKLKFPGRMLMRKGPDESYVGVVPAIAGVLYFKGGHTSEGRQRIAECFALFTEQAKAELRWMLLSEPPKGPDRYPVAKAPPLGKYLDALDKSYGFGIVFHNGQQDVDAGDWTFEVFARHDWQARMPRYGPDVLRFSMPLLHVLDNPTAFQRLFVSLADKLGAVHGHGGYALMLSSMRESDNQSFEAWFVPQANGFDAGHPLSVARHAQDKLKTVSWLTAVNAQMVKKVGGQHRLYSELPRDWFAFYPYSNGLVIQGGPSPNAAALSIDPKPAIYVLPHMLFKDVIADDIKGLHNASVSGEPRMNESETRDWMQRFEVPDSELMAYRAKLLGEPKLTEDTTLPDRL
jgi:hypothetical protein